MDHIGSEHILNLSFIKLIMSLSDCVKCWETPCVCGHQYKDYSDEKSAELIVSFLMYKSKFKQRLILKMAEDIVKRNKAI